MLSPDDPTQIKKRKNRDREGAGKSEQSWMKHELLAQVVSGQVAAFRVKNGGRILLIDGNGGDGIGVDRLQLDMFDDNLSRTTPEMLMRLAGKLGNVDVILCEKDPDKRIELAKRFQQATILSDHADAVKCIREDHVYVVWVSDPCGPRDHGTEHMANVAKRIPSDFAVVFNEGAVNRIAATTAEIWATARERYTPMLEPGWWLRQLGRRRMSRTRTIKATANFHYRVLVISNYLTDAAKRKPFEVVR